MGLSHTVSGDIASFRTPSRVPIENLKFYFLPKQEGSGDPSPTNVRPITGWTGLNWRRTGKNIAHVLWSTNGGDADAQQKLSNNYGTSIDTLKYIEPDGRVVITQTKWDNPSLVRSYMNGYVAPIISNLQRDGFYDVSFKVTNITSNPLNASLSDIALSDPYGNGYLNPTVIGNVVIFKNYKHRCKDTYPNRKHFELRICGMNCTISELMATPANKSDGVFEPFYGEIFRLNDKNILEPYPNTSENYGVSWTVNNNGVVEYDGTPTSWSNIIVGYIHLNGRTTLYGKIFGDQSNVSFGTMCVYDSNDTRIGTIGTGWEAQTPNNDYVTVNLSEYTGASYVRVEVKRHSNDIPMKGKCYVVVTDNLEDLMRKDIVFPSIVYGGYVDLVAGEIVAEYAIDESNGNTWTVGSARAYQWNHANGKDSIYYSKSNVCTHWINNKHTYYSQEETVEINQNGAFCIGKDFFTAAGFDYENLTSSQIEEYLTQQKNNGTPFRVCYPLANPIHIPITPQQLKAYLDHNNFWSDANAITKVTYAVTESKDILATRKKAMDFDIAHHKKVNWNQLVKDGNFTSRDHWSISANDYGTVSVNDNIAAWTYTNPELQYYYHTGLTNKQFYLNIPENHRVLVKATVRSSVSRTDSNHRVSIFGMINYENSYAYTQNDVQANTWTDLFGFIRDNRTEGKKITRFKVCYGGTVNDGTIPVGTVLEVKNFMAFDLTQMFGLGNEPSTVEEFEHICEINGIDLTTYQPYDEGSDRWLIIP